MPTTNKHDPQDLLNKLLQACGNPDRCRKCKADVLKMTKNGAAILMDPDGVVHWMRCTPETRLSRVLNTLGSTGNCKSCGAPVLWITSKNGKPTIWNKNGVSHWATCPNAAKHKTTAKESP